MAIHIFFRWNGEANTARRLPGIDTRGEGGYVICYDADTMLKAHADKKLPKLDPKLLEAPEQQAPQKPRREPSAPAGRWTPTGGALGLRSIMEAECSELAATGTGGRNSKLNDVALRLGRIVHGRAP